MAQGLEAPRHPLALGGGFDQDPRPGLIPEHGGEALRASYRYQRQDDRAGSQDLQKNVFFLGLTATDQFRLR